MIIRGNHDSAIRKRFACRNSVRTRLTLAFFGVGWAASALEAGSFELTPRHGVTFDGRSGDGLAFGVLPTHPVLIEHKLNQWNQFEQHVTPAVEHPIPVLRAAHVQLYAERPDTDKLGLDQARTFQREAKLSDQPQYAIVADNETAALIHFTSISLPPDRDEEWKIIGTIEPLNLKEHIDDSVADRGRAIESGAPLPLSGKLVFGMGGVDGFNEFHRYDFATATEQKIGGGHAAMMANDGTIVDALDIHHVVVTDNGGKELARITNEPFDIKQFTVAPDGKRFAMVIDAFENVFAPIHKKCVEVYAINGRKLGQVTGYDDPAFLPDGRVLLTGEGIQPGLFIFDIKTGKTELLAVEGVEPKVDYPKNPVVSPDGKWVAYEERNHRVALVGIDGRNWQEVWNQTNHSEAVPVFSPDSQFIAMIIQGPDYWSSPGTVNVFDVRMHVRQVLSATAGASPNAALTWMP